MSGTVFYKMSGSGNDFIMLDGRHERPGEWPASRIRDVCDRRIGVGADGLVILTPRLPGQVEMTFFNCDGSRAAMCGNAALCSTRLAAFLELAPEEAMQLVTDAGVYQTRCIGAGDLAEITLPGFDLPAHPPSIGLGKDEEEIHLLTVGVPHLVVLVPDVENLDLLGRGRELRFHSESGPAGANVNFISPLTAPNGNAWAIRTYERGVEGETLACGTGAVAAAVSLAANCRSGLPMDLVTRSGGALRISAVLSGRRVESATLAGEGRRVFRGILA